MVEIILLRRKLRESIHKLGIDSTCGSETGLINSLLFTITVFFFPAFISYFLLEEDGVVVLIGSLGWTSANTVIFGVILSENYSDDKFVTSKDFQREFIVIFMLLYYWSIFGFVLLDWIGSYDITGPVADVNTDQTAFRVYFRLPACSFIVTEPQGNRVVFVDLDACRGSQLVTIKVEV